MHPHHIRIILAAFLLAMLAACGVLKADEDARRAAERAYADLVLARDEDLISRFPRELNTPAARQTLVQMRTFIPKGRAAASELVGFNNFTGTSGQTARIVTRYRYDAASVIFTADFRRSSAGQPWQLSDIFVAPAGKAELDAPRFGEPGALPPAKAASVSPNVPA